MSELFEAVREAASERAWGAAVKLAREGAVAGVHEDGDEVLLRVKAVGRALPHEVYLWPAEEDWGCDCELPGDACIHVCAAVIALRKGRTAGDALPVPEKTFRVRLSYAFTTSGDSLSVTRQVLWPDGRQTPLDQPLAQANILTERADVQAEVLLAMLPPGRLSADTMRRLLRLLDHNPQASLDGRPVTISAEPVLFQVRVTDQGEGFKLGLYRPDDVDRLFRGASLVGNTLRPTSHGDLSTEQRKMLVRGVTFAPDEVGRLVGDMLPKLRERIPVKVATERLPAEEQVIPQVELNLAEAVAGLEVTSRLVYGDPPVAVVEKGVFRPVGEVVPGRDMAAERLATRELESVLGLVVGVRRVFPPHVAAAFLTEQLPLWKGPVRGRIRRERFRVSVQPIEASIEVEAAGPGRFRLGVAFRGAEGEARPEAVLSAWRSNQPLVPLIDGGYAPLPEAWLRRHGSMLRELLEARSADQTVPRHATGALVELLEDTEADVPPDLHRLQSFLEGEGELSDAPIPDGFHGELRPYQEAGFRWLRFLREVELEGILADDMGLGKTIQALVALLETPGPHLIVAPTSVLSNWARESQRFTPGLSVNLYHGATRSLDDSDLTLTSYALLRLDLEILAERHWGYVVLDEAQAIKNPSSQTAKAACRIRSRHRLAMSGTPIENRLDELWSLFRFLMPGFLGSRQSFKERFAQPATAGDPRAAQALHRRIRPYVLRRLKKQVAAELPPLTDVVVRCEMGDGQREIYETVRAAAWQNLESILGDSDTVMRGNLQVLEALLRMRQACCDPSLLPGGGEGAGAAKLDRLEELLLEMVCEDHKALVFSQWTSLLDRVEPRLEALGIDWVRLDGSTRDRQAVIDRFQDPQGPPVFLLSLKAGGTGLNLTAADYVVHLDPWWNPAVQQQATDRAHRIGQDKPVVSYRIIAADTVEERVLALQEAKKALADAALGVEGGMMSALSANELRSLFVND